MQINRVSRLQFAQAFARARRRDARVREATCKPSELPLDAAFHLSDDGLSGFAINEGDELVALFSLIKGRGEALVLAAIDAGAARLDCFDGFLPRFYERFGFTEERREPNWTPGEPDVIWMRLR